MISAAEVSGRDLWIVAHDATLMSLNLDTGVRQPAVSENVVGIARSRDDIWLLRALPDGRVSIARVVDGAARNVAAYAPEANDVPITLFTRGESVTVLSTNSAHSYSEGGWSTLHLATPIRSVGNVVVGAPSAGDNVYLGFDRGEWGGGVVRIDMATGAVSGLVQVGEIAICGGALREACGPTTAIIADPRRHDCVIVAQGLVHFIPWGRILRVCGDTVTQVYQHQYRAADANERSEMTVPFFALAPTRRGFLATGAGKLYRFEGGEPVVTDAPRLTRRGDIWAAEDRVNRVVLVGAEVRRQFSVSGFSILLARMDELNHSNQ